MKKTIIILTICSLFGCLVYSQIEKKTKTMAEQKTYPKALVNFDDFKDLTSEVEKHRQSRLVSLDDFLKMSREPNTIILDSRSTFRYERKHLKGAVHLSFTDFTQRNLEELIPDKETRILIYCNNNFDGDQIDFASKMAMPESLPETQILTNRKPVMLALNIPTHINLYGYGYRNVYELDELVNVNDKRIEFEGTVVLK
ncbi:MAG: rhodanese-like domain-containing protein [Tannerella sp.]|jgi:hypothetical protein|nr:rhodanese-like domain-containing protein [Tannerella sp.]